MDLDALEREALRVYRRYQLEVVEGLRLCPWAERARLDGRVREVIVTDRTPGAPDVAETISTLAEDTTVEIGLVIFPQVVLRRLEFEHFVAELVKIDADRHELGRSPFAMAAFHPDAEPNTDDAERLIPFLRRTPDPTIQLVRHEALERVREGDSGGTAFVDPSALASLDFTATPTAPLRERIARANLNTVQQRGLERVEALLDDILRDRDTTYEALGAPSRRR